MLGPSENIDSVASDMYLALKRYDDSTARSKLTSLVNLLREVPDSYTPSEELIIDGKSTNLLSMSLRSIIQIAAYHPDDIESCAEALRLILQLCDNKLELTDLEPESLIALNSFIMDMKNEFKDNPKATDDENNMNKLLLAFMFFEALSDNAILTRMEEKKIPRASEEEDYKTYLLELMEEVQYSTTRQRRKPPQMDKFRARFTSLYQKNEKMIEHFSDKKIQLTRSLIKDNPRPDNKSSKPKRKPTLAGITRQATQKIRKLAIASAIDPALSTFDLKEFREKYLEMYDRILSIPIYQRNLEGKTWDKVVDELPSVAISKIPVMLSKERAIDLEYYTIESQSGFSERKPIIIKFSGTSGDCVEQLPDFIDEAWHHDSTIVAFNYQVDEHTSQQDLIDQGKKLVEYILKNNKDIDPRMIVLHGHSFGGALAAQVTAQLQEEGIEVGVCHDRGYTQLSHAAHDEFPLLPKFLFDKALEGMKLDFNITDAWPTIAEENRLMLYSEEDIMFKFNSLAATEGKLITAPSLDEAIPISGYPFDKNSAAHLSRLRCMKDEEGNDAEQLMYDFARVRMAPMLQELREKKRTRIRKLENSVDVYKQRFGQKGNLQSLTESLLSLSSSRGSKRAPSDVPKKRKKTKRKKKSNSK